MTTHATRTIALAAVAIAGLAWIDPLFIPLVTLGPLLSGLAAGAAGAPPRHVALVWLAAGMLMLVSDLAINQEDVVFHAVVGIVDGALALGAAALGARLHRRRVLA